MLKPKARERGIASARRVVIIEIGIAIELGGIGETFDNNPDPDPDFERSRSCCATQT